MTFTEEQAQHPHMEISQDLCFNLKHTHAQTHRHTQTDLEAVNHNYDLNLLSGACGSRTGDDHRMIRPLDGSDV